MSSPADASSTVARIRSGRLCSSGGTGRTSRSQPHRFAIRWIWSASAPQATTVRLIGCTLAYERGGVPGEPGGSPTKAASERRGHAGETWFHPRERAWASDSCRKRQLVDEQVVEVRAARELDIVDLVQ